jgi:ADP-ribose pyrophosphatase
MAQSAEPSPPKLPPIVLELVEDLSPPDQNGFLRLVRHRYRAKYPDGSLSAPFLYDAVDRKSLDAVVIAAHFLTQAGERRVYLRSAVRPPLTLRDPAHSTLEGERFDGLLWELPAGMIDLPEQSPAGVPRAAQRELLEELGFDVSLSALQPLGRSMFPVPGFCAERQFYFEVAVNPQKRRDPQLDGSALEHFGVVVDVALSEALDWCRQGVIEDSKTELALRRLWERFA